MCGIAGFIDFRERLTSEDLRRMTSTLLRRGPDGEGTYFSNGVGLGMRRLAIIDLEGGWQPVYNEDRTIALVFNGEIYNYRELRERLIAAGHGFRTRGDSEVIVHLYEEFGLDFPKHLEGMFAVAIWDTRQQRLVLVRDRLGIKPLFVSRSDAGVVFGSELKAVMASGVVPDGIDWQAVDQYFTYTVIPAPRSIYAAVSKFPPAHMAIIGRDGSYEERSYWTLPPPETIGGSVAKQARALEPALLDAVRCHMVSDVPVGAFLSGGVDSSLIVAMMAGLSSTPVQAFTVGFRASGKGFIDERALARELAARYSVEHVEVEVTPDVAAILPSIVDAVDEPFADDSVIPSYYVSQVTASHVKVAMTGLGGDELFAGYKRHLGIRFAGTYSKLPAFIRKGLVAPVVRRIPEGILPGDLVDHMKRFTAANAGSLAEQYDGYMSACSVADRDGLFAPDVLAGVRTTRGRRLVADLFNASQARSPVERALRADIGFYLPDDILALTDRISMWHSLELRVPFLHHPLVELAAGMDASGKISGTMQKAVLREVARKWVPASILNHRKQGFEAPMGAWLRGPLLPLFDEMTSPELVRRVGVLRPEVIARLREEHVSGARKNSKVMFSILMFMLWATHHGVRLA